MAKRTYTLSDEAREQRIAAGHARNPTTEDWTSVRLPKRVAEAVRRKVKGAEPLWRVIERAFPK